MGVSPVLRMHDFYLRIYIFLQNLQKTNFDKFSFFVILYSKYKFEEGNGVLLGKGLAPDFCTFCVWRDAATQGIARFLYKIEL